MTSFEARRIVQRLEAARLGTGRVKMEMVAPVTAILQAANTKGVQISPGLKVQIEALGQNEEK